MTDRLRITHINSLPQPFVAHFYDGSEWPVVDIDVETGLLRIDVCGLIGLKHIGDVKSFIDQEGVEHTSESFYNDCIPLSVESLEDALQDAVYSVYGRPRCNPLATQCPRCRNAIAKCAIAECDFCETGDYRPQT